MRDEEEIVEYVYIPDEGIYGTIVRYGAWSSLVQYYDSGIQYNIEVPNDEYIVVDEIGVGYLEETQEGISYPEEEDYL
jgi:hypothetical protein